MSGPPPIDEALLERSAEQRYAYLAAFIGLDDVDLAVIRGARETLQPQLESMVAQMTGRVLDFEPAARHFRGPDGVVDQPAITVHLRGYLERLLTAPGGAGFGAYLDGVGATHRETAGNPRIDVPQVQVNALLGFIADLVIRTISQLELPVRQRVRAIRAFNKLLWIQNDLMGRHYCPASPDQRCGPSDGKAGHR